MFSLFLPEIMLVDLDNLDKRVVSIEKKARRASSGWKARTMWSRMATCYTSASTPEGGILAELS